MDPDRSSYYSKDRPELVAAVDPGTSNVVLDVGCGAGAMGARLREAGRASELWGIEVVPEAAQAARARGVYDRLLEGSVEDLVDELPASHFTHVVAGDVLEHLVDPWTVLRGLRRALAPGGRIVCSLPNIRNTSFFAKLLLRGTFEYKDSGVLDRTHLRFFAPRDMRRLFEDTGFRDVVLSPARPKKRVGSRLAKAMLGTLAVKVFLVTAQRAER